MKGLTNVLFATLATFASVSAAPKGKQHASSAAAAAAPTTAAVAVAAAAAGTITRGASTIVMKEVGGIAGNECLTFRNNGEIVDAACVNTSADRQVTPSTTSSGANVLLVQRSFTADFRPDLVGVQACVGFNGSDFLAMDCAGSATQFVSLVGGELKSGTTCQSGHDSAAQLTVDTTGTKCVGVTLTTVVATAP